MVTRHRPKLHRDRERNLCKKANELSILCGTDVFMIIFNPHKTEPETWPQERSEVDRMINKYKMIVNSGIKGMRSTSSLAIRDATNATTSHSTSGHNPNKKMKLDLNVSDCYDSEIRGKVLRADYNIMNPEDDEAKLGSLEAKRQALTKIIASRKANYFEFL